jgi:hypothetical protein
MTDVNTFLKRALLAAAISVLPLANTASAHGGGHGTGGSSSSSGGSSSGGSSSGGSSSGGSSSGGSSSSGGHSSSGSNGGHSSGGHSSSSTSGGHTAAASKAGHPATDPAADPSNVSQSVTTGQGMHSGKVHRAFAQQGRSTGYNQQNTETNQDDWRRRHPHLLFGFIRY